MNTTSPTIEQFAAYQAAYDYFNRVLFGGELKPCLLNFRGKHKRNMGLFWPEKWKRGETQTHEIALNPEVLHRPLIDTFSTLVHEMVHQWQEDFGSPPRGNYHNKEWGAKMESIGLMPSNTGEPGGKKTGQQMTHYVIEGGRYAAAFRDMPEETALPWLTGCVEEGGKPVSKNKNKVKYVCPCKTNIWGKAEIEVICSTCGEPFTAT